MFSTGTDNGFITHKERENKLLNGPFEEHFAALQLAG